jgi:hypothetical protein
MEQQDVGILEFGKAVDDIEKPKLLPEDFYLMLVTGTPTSKQNNDKTGYNWTIPLKTLHRSVPEFAGRRFTAYLPLPNAEDEHEYDGRGQKVYDAKMDRIHKFVVAFGGQVNGRTVILGVGAKGGLKVIQQINPRSQELSNSLNIFGVYKTAAEMGWSAEDEAEYQAQLIAEAPPF